MTSGNLSIAYCTNIWSHHQGPVSWELLRLLGEEGFRLCLFEAVHQERQEMGWAGGMPDQKWILGPPRTSDDYERISEAVCDADVAVLGACPEGVQRARAATGKLTFIMNERLMRSGFFRLRMINPRFAYGIRRLRGIANRPNVHYLAIGKHAFADAKLLKVFDDRIWSWAYFVPPAGKACHKRDWQTVRLLWAGRFVKLKRVDMILRAMAMLSPITTDCTLELIGAGPTRDAIKALTYRLGLASRVFFRDTMTHEEVRERMAEADIYIFPSNKQEGWGAVVGEAMCEGCVVIASNAAGASEILIDQGRTGFLFSDGDVGELANILGQVIKNEKLRRKVGASAALHMMELWHPRVGAERLIELCRDLLAVTPMPKHAAGPCVRLVAT